LSLSNLFLFLQLKSMLKGHWFVSSEVVTAKVTRTLTKISEIGFQECFQKLYKCWKKRVAAQGNVE
jgi:hypothetical protein